MNYKIVSEKASMGKVILAQSRGLQIGISIFLALFGLLSFPLGIILFLSPDGDIYSASTWTGIGLFMLSAIILMNTNKNLPRYLIFDNIKGQFKIKEKKKDKKEFVAFPYSEIEDFHLRIHRSNRSKNYVVEMEKKDGAFWTLFISSRHKRAEKFLLEIKKRVALTVKGSMPDNIEKPLNIDLTETPQKTTLSWKIKQRTLTSLFGFTAIFSFAMIILGIRPVAENIIAYTIALIFIISILLIMIFYLFFSLRRKHFLEITKDDIRYYSRGPLTSGKQFTMKIDQLKAVLFNFSILSPDMAIFFLTHEEMILFQKIKRGQIDFGELLTALMRYAKIKRIKTGELLTSEKVHLENFIQNIISINSKVKNL